MGEPLRKLKIDGGDFERNNEDCFDLNDLASPRTGVFAPRGCRKRSRPNVERKACDLGVMGI